LIIHYTKDNIDGIVGWERTSTMPNDILSLLWWFFSVVIIGIVVGLVPPYLKPRIDTFLARYSKSRREKLEQKKVEQEEKIEFMLSDSSEYILKNYIDHGF
jgi:hypothetical protein